MMLPNLFPWYSVYNCCSSNKCQDDFVVALVGVMTICLEDRLECLQLALRHSFQSADVARAFLSWYTFKFF